MVGLGVRYVEDVAVTAYKEKYGNWAGNPEGAKPDLTRCCEEVGRDIGHRTSFGQCTRKRGYGPGGEYCKQHDPAAVKARREKSDSEWKAKFNKDRVRYYGASFLAVLQQIADGHNDPRTLAKETIEAYEKGAR